MSNFLATLEKLAETVGTALGGPVVPAVIEIGKDVVNLIKSAKDVVNTNEQESLDSMLASLEPRVMAHADHTEETLRGQG